jgi:hypothetical protein
MQEWKPKPTRPWQRANGAIIDRVLVIVDRFSSKRANLYPRYERGTPPILGKVFAILGTLETITSDRDKISKSREWRCPMKVLRMTTPKALLITNRLGGQTEKRYRHIYGTACWITPKKLSKGIANCSVRIP